MLFNINNKTYDIKNYHKSNYLSNLVKYQHNNNVITLNLYI